MEPRPLGPGGRPVERRARQPLLYRPDQLLGRRKIYLRRAADKRRLAAHLAAVVALVGLSIWWVVPLHSFAGPVLVSITASHGVHLGDLTVFAFVLLALRSLGAARRLVFGPVA
jgi:hypothetical protein